MSGQCCRMGVLLWDIGRFSHVTQTQMLLHLLPIVPDHIHLLTYTCMFETCPVHWVTVQHLGLRAREL